MTPETWEALLTVLVAYAIGCISGFAMKGDGGPLVNVDMGERTTHKHTDHHIHHHRESTKEHEVRS